MAPDLTLTEHSTCPTVLKACGERFLKRRGGRQGGNAITIIVIIIIIITATGGWRIPHSAG
jgi:hypothetical protein